MVGVVRSFAPHLTSVMLLGVVSISCRPLVNAPPKPRGSFYPCYVASGLAVRCRMTTGSPQPIPQLTHRNHMATLHTRPRYDTAHATDNLISCMGRATHPPHDNTLSTSLPPSSRLCCQQIQITVICCHCLSFDLLPRPRKCVRRVKGHTPCGTHPPKCSCHLLARVHDHWPIMPRENWCL